MDIYKRLIGFIRPYRMRLVSAILASQGEAFFTALISATLYVIINGLANKHEVIISKIPHLSFIPEIRFPAFWIPFILVFVFTLRGIFRYISEYMMASIGIRAIRQIRDDLYDHLVYCSNDYYSRGRTGDFLSRIMNDVGQIQGSITDVIADLVKQPFVILYNIPMVFLWGGKYAFFAIAIFPVVAVPITFLGKNIRRTTKKMQEKTADITAFIGETLAGINIVKSFNCEEKEIARFHQTNRSVFDYFKKTIRLTMIQRPLIEIMGAIGAAAAVWFAISNLPPDRFGAFVISLFIFYEPIKKLSKVNSTVQQSIAAGARIFEVLDTKPTVLDQPGALAFQETIQNVAYENVSFAYEKNNPVLRNINFQVKRGEVVALVGASGSGKSTLANLLLRFYDPIEGKILINGKDVRSFSLKSLRDQIGIVTQDTILFNSTVRGNIAYGKDTASMEEVKRAAAVAFADHFIEELPNAYDTNLGERGLKLSGGQRQRIAIARALLKNPPILILDEATSHLDTESEREVQRALENAMKGRTVFVIAHRLSTIQNADRIFVMQEGRIVQQGTNDSLLKEGGIYRKLYDLQFSS